MDAALDSVTQVLHQRTPPSESQLQQVIKDRKSAMDARKAISATDQPERRAKANLVVAKVQSAVAQLHLKQHNYKEAIAAANGVKNAADAVTGAHPASPRVLQERVLTEVVAVRRALASTDDDVQRPEVAGFFVKVAEDALAKVSHVLHQEAVPSEEQLQQLIKDRKEAMDAVKAISAIDHPVHRARANLAVAQVQSAAAQLHLKQGHYAEAVAAAKGVKNAADAITNAHPASPRALQEQVLTEVVAVGHALVEGVDDKHRLEAERFVKEAEDKKAMLFEETKRDEILHDIEDTLASHPEAKIDLKEEAGKAAAALKANKDADLSDSHSDSSDSDGWGSDSDDDDEEQLKAMRQRLRQEAGGLVTPGDPTDNRPHQGDDVYDSGYDSGEEGDEDEEGEYRQELAAGAVDEFDGGVAAGELEDEPEPAAGAVDIQQAAENAADDEELEEGPAVGPAAEVAAGYVVADVIGDGDLAAGEQINPEPIQNDNGGEQPAAGAEGPAVSAAGAMDDVSAPEVAEVKQVQNAGDKRSDRDSVEEARLSSSDSGSSSDSDSDSDATWTSSDDDGYDNGEDVGKVKHASPEEKQAGVDAEARASVPQVTSDQDRAPDPQEARLDSAEFSIPTSKVKREGLIRTNCGKLKKLISDSEEGLKRIRKEGDLSQDAVETRCKTIETVMHQAWETFDQIKRCANEDGVGLDADKCVLSEALKSLAKIEEAGNKSIWALRAKNKKSPQGNLGDQVTALFLRCEGMNDLDIGGIKDLLRDVSELRERLRESNSHPANKLLRKKGTLRIRLIDLLKDKVNSMNNYSVDDVEKMIVEVTKLREQLHNREGKKAVAPAVASAADKLLPMKKELRAMLKERKDMGDAPEYRPK